LSYLLGIYFQDFSAYSKGYGSLGVALAFRIWLYWSGVVVFTWSPIQCRTTAERSSDVGACGKTAHQAYFDRVREGDMTDQVWTVKELIEALKKFPSDARVYYEMGPNGVGTIGQAIYVKARGEEDQLGVLLDR